MLFFLVVLVPLLATALSEEVWDPEDPRCEAVRNGQAGLYWQDEYMDQAYSWIDAYNGGSNFNTWFLYRREMEDVLEKGCDEYEDNKKEWPYRCFSQQFICAAKDVIRATVDGSEEKMNFNDRQSWYKWFNPPGHGWRNPRDEEVNWILKLRWNDPKLEYWAKKDLEQHASRIFDRLFYYIETNNINSLEQIFNNYRSYGVEELMRQRCQDLGGNKTEMVCKVDIVFNRMAELVIDSNDIPWDIPAGPPPRTREELAALYLLQPDVAEIMDMSSEAHNRTLCYRLKTLFGSLYKRTLEEKGDEIKDHFGKFGTISINTKRDCEEVHHNDFEQLNCYLSETFHRMGLLTRALGVNFDNWDAPRAQSMRAVVMMWLLLTPKGMYYAEREITDLKRAQSATALLEIMYEKIKTNQVEELREMAILMPSESQMGLTSVDECTPDFNRISTNMKCGFKMVLESLHMYLEQYDTKDLRTRNLDLSVDHKERLKQFQISSIKDEVTNTQLTLMSSLEEFSSEIKQYVEASNNNGFSSLKQYFQRVADFDEEIAVADVGYITGKLDGFTTTAAELAHQLERDAFEMQGNALTIASIDATFMWLKAAGAGISAVLGVLGGDFSGFADAADRIDEAAAATLKAVQVDAIKDQIQMATDHFRVIKTGLDSNRAHLDKTKAIIDKLRAEETTGEEFDTAQKEFLDSYNAYTPAVDEAQIDALDAAWNAVVDNLEESMMSTRTKEGLVLSTYMFVENHVFKLKIAVPQLSTTLKNRFDYQDELMTSLTAVVRARTSKEAANSLGTTYAGLEGEMTESELARVALNQMALSTYVLSQFHLLLILSQFCNYATYRNAAVETSQCSQALSTMETNHIDDALSYLPPACDEVDVHLRIPTSDKGNSDSINLHRLNSGEPIAFKIPDFQWLQTNGDLSPNDETSALFVKHFEIYALTSDDYQLKSNLRVTVTPSGPAPVYLAPGQMKYELRPVSRTQFVFEYRENYRGNCDPEVNPYTVCSPGPKGICVQSRGALNNELQAYPSVYSPWTIKLDENIGHAPKPAPGTSLFLQAKLKLCRQVTDSGGRRKKRSLKAKKKHLRKVLKKHRKHHVLKDSARTTCPAGKYFNQESVLFAACPAGSAPQRNGYYCQVNESPEPSPSA